MQRGGTVSLSGVYGGMLDPLPLLTYLLGYPQVRNYDGSWTEWGTTAW